MSTHTEKNSMMQRRGSEGEKGSLKSKLYYCLFLPPFLNFSISLGPCPSVLCVFIHVSLENASILSILFPKLFQVIKLPISSMTQGSRYQLGIKRRANHTD